MSLISDTLISHLPFRRRQTPSGWISFNAVCCQDQRNRGGVIMDGEAISYHCFNCGFKASWQPGRTISAKMRKLFTLLNVSDEMISKLCIEAFRHKDEEISTNKFLIPKFEHRTLPRGSEPINSLIDSMPDRLIPVIEYIYSRGLTLDDYPFHWSSEEGFDNRLIIPYYYKGDIVGYTGRRIDQGSPKYLAEQQPGYVFNLDHQTEHRKFVIVCEGQLDAISIGAVSIMGSDINQAQILLINQLQRDVIVLPDRDSAGKKLVNAAIKMNWSVSFPPWEEGIKDANDAIKRYGRLNTLKMIRENSTQSEVKIKLFARDWFKEQHD